MRCCSDEEVVAAVERKTLEDLAASLLSGKLTYALAELTALPRAAVVVEDRYSRLFKLEHAPGARVAEALAEAQARFPAVPIVFCETRPLAQEWTYRWLGACLAELTAADDQRRYRIELSPPAPRSATGPCRTRSPRRNSIPPAVRAWAQSTLGFAGQRSRPVPADRRAGLPARRSRRPNSRPSRRRRTAKPAVSRARCPAAARPNASADR